MRRPCNALTRIPAPSALGGRDRPSRGLGVLAVFASLGLVGCNPGSSAESDAGCIRVPCVAADASGNRDGANDSSARDASEPDAGVPSRALVDVSWLQAHLDDPEVQVLDVRARSAYETSHVPGALHLPVSAVRATVDGVRGQIAGRDTVASAAAEAGLRREATVIVYGDQRGLHSARMMWTLQHYGHGDVRRLDGGWSTWRQMGTATASGGPNAPATDYAIEQPRAELRVDADWVLDHLDDPSVTIVDVRTTAEHEDGHIPGARHYHWAEAIDSDARMRPMAELSRALSDIPERHTVVTYCTTGTRGSMGWFTFRWLGYRDVRLYDGSWAEWGSRSDLPKETE